LRDESERDDEESKLISFKREREETVLEIWIRERVIKE
jgi:hypothetical protein